MDNQAHYSQYYVYPFSTVEIEFLDPTKSLGFMNQEEVMLTMTEQFVDTLELELGFVLADGPISKAEAIAYALQTDVAEAIKRLRARQPKPCL